MLCKASRQERLIQSYNELGLHPQAILAQAQSGMLLPGWQVFRGKRKSQVATLAYELIHGCNIRAVGLFFLVCTVFALPMFFCENADELTAVITNPSYRTGFNFWTSPLFPLSEIFIVSLIGLPLFVFLVAYFHDLFARDPLLVILPKGLVEFDQLIKLQACIIFSELADVRRQEPAIVGKERSADALDLVYRDGVTLIWAPQVPAGAAIIVAFQQWQENAEQVG